MSQLDMFAQDKIEPTSKAQICPCCGQTVKMYKEKLRKAALRSLIKLCSETKNGEYRHINDMSTYGGGFAKLRYWGLVEEMPNDSHNKKTSGWWTATQLGRDFIEGKTTMRTYIKLYNATFYGFDGGMVTINEALDDGDFNYREHMQR